MKNYNEYMKNYMLNRYYKRRNDFINRLGNKCVSCGKKDNLELDHIDPSIKSFNISKALSSWSIKKIEAEFVKLQLLCKECHIQKTIIDKSNSPWKHGTLSDYRYCKCLLCKKAKSDYMKEYNKRKNIK